jgi:photosystem II stability/assembly factor-like uncharacterized protein
MKKSSRLGALRERSLMSVLRGLIPASLIVLMLMCGALLSLASTLSAQPFDAKYLSGMRWRSIGPYRGGRTRAAAGVPSQPNVFYIGVCNGGVWKTTDYGRTWLPIFDDQPTGSIGAIAVAVSDPNIVYVACGEGLQRPDLSVGDGIYKSEDAGQTWTHLGLRDGQQIPQIIVDPRNADRLFVAVLGHPYGPNEERGIFRSTDGGKTFQKVLYKDENTGGSELAFDPTNPDIVYAGLWESRQGPWENAAWSGTGGGLFKSTDGGTTWRQLNAAGADGVVQINLGIAPSDPRRIYAAITTSRGAGIYRSDDAGETWTRPSTDNRPASRIGGGDLPRLAVHPKNPDIVFVTSTVSWKSVDGGKTWVGFKGAPGGDDYQNLWINPNNPDIILYASDQGAVVTVNGGETWSSWYNQPTAQFYHVAADNAFPYRLYSGQQESGSVGISSRGNDGQITFREWHPVGVDEYDYVAPDPLDPDIIYGGRSVTRYDRRTGQVQNVGPTAGVRRPGWRTVRTQPVLFSPVDPHILYFASNTLWKTSNGGQTWQQISPDLTRKTWDVPANVGKYKSETSAQPSQRGVIYTIAPSYIDVNRIWVGTDDGLIHVTADGGLHWTDVTPSQLGPWAKVSIMDAGRFDVQTAYAAINTLRLDDMRPHIFRTHDGGKTWTHITNGIPDGAPADAVREDPKRKGLLFAGTEREVYVSFDDGDHWQSLRLNMPATSIRDLIIKDDDLAVATHGRGFWILDDITPLRQLDASVVAAEAFLFKPAVAYRVRWNMNTDTPLPPEEPGGQNPPEGAIINYALKSDATGPVTLEILDAAGKVVRKYSSTDAAELPTPATAPVPLYWYRPPQVLKTTAGMHRFMWDMRYQSLGVGGGRGGLPMAAIAHNTAPSTGSMWAPPGEYTVKLTANGKSYTQPITVKMDPRVKTPAAGIAQQSELSKSLYEGAVEAQAALTEMRAIRAQIKPIQDKARGNPAMLEALAGFDKKAESIEGAAGAGFGRRGGGGGMPPGMRGGGGAEAGQDTLSSIGGSLTQLMNLMQAADRAPTAQVAKAVAERKQGFTALMTKWKTFKTQDIAALNVQLKAANLPTIEIK